MEGSFSLAGNPGGSNWKALKLSGVGFSAQQPILRGTASLLCNGLLAAGLLTQELVPLRNT